MCTAFPDCDKKRFYFAVGAFRLAIDERHATRFLYIESCCSSTTSCNTAPALIAYRPLGVSPTNW